MEESELLAALLFVSVFVILIPVSIHLNSFFESC
jgi:hypothetical protein